jgi:RNA polymerase sigma-70 factor (ECF subfamily)
MTEAARAAPQQAEDFDALFLRHWAEIHRLLQRMVGDEAEDAAQDVFLKLHTKPPPPGSNYRAWLYKVATREGLNRLRGRGRRDGLLGRIKSLWEPALEPGPEVAAQRGDERRAVREALSRMRPLQAEALLLRHGGLEYAEIAEALDVRRGSVGTLLARAEAQFARLYEAQEGGGES